MEDVYVSPIHSVVVPPEQAQLTALKKALIKHRKESLAESTAPQHKVVSSAPIISKSSLKDEEAFVEAEDTFRPLERSLSPGLLSAVSREETVEISPVPSEVASQLSPVHSVYEGPDPGHQISPIHSVYTKSEAEAAKITKKSVTLIDADLNAPVPVRGYDVLTSSLVSDSQFYSVIEDKQVSAKAKGGKKRKISTADLKEEIKMVCLLCKKGVK